MADVKQVYQRPMKALDRLGEELAFYIRALIATPRSVTRYRKEILRLLAEVALGSGALAVITPTVPPMTASDPEPRVTSARIRRISFLYLETVRGVHASAFR